MVGSGRVGDLNAKQQAALKEFKAQLGSSLQPYMDDYYLLRWLRARSFDVKKAHAMLKTSLEWRKSYGTDTILETFQPPEVLLKHYPGGVYGFDKQGHPIWIDSLGCADLKGLSQSAKKSDIIRFRVWYMEKLYKMLDEQTAKLGTKVDEVTMIFDMDKIGLKHLWKPAIDTFTEILSVVEANYPETLRKCFVINAPRVLPVLWNVAKPFLHEETRKKIQFFKGNWKEKLLDEIEADQLPVYWGGNALGENDDPHCGISMGGTIPDQYKIPKLNMVDMEGFEVTTIGRSSSIQLNYQVTVAGSVLRWQFQTDGSDIGFGVYKKTQPGHQAIADMICVVINQRVNSHMVPEEGSVKCDEVGTYVVHFDNTYSWVNAKKLSYLIEVLEPTEEEMEITAL